MSSPSLRASYSQLSFPQSAANRLSTLDSFTGFTPVLDLTNEDVWGQSSRKLKSIKMKNQNFTYEEAEAQMK